MMRRCYFPPNILHNIPRIPFQDVFLSHVENGTITMIGATTENPSFHVNSALLSRCRVFVLNKLSTKDIMTILCNAVKTLEGVVMERRSMNDMSLHNTNDTR